MTTRLALTQIDELLRAMAARPAMYGREPETVLQRALDALETRAALLGNPGAEATYQALKAEHKIPSPLHASDVYALPEVGAFIGELYARERQRVPDAPTAEERLLSLRVDFRDEQAAAEITPEMASAYLTARGWRCDPGPIWVQWTRKRKTLMTPVHNRFVDYGRRMVELVNEVAAIEGRSPLAVWAEMRCP